MPPYLVTVGYNQRCCTQNIALTIGISSRVPEQQQTLAWVDLFFFLFLK